MFQDYQRYIRPSHHSQNQQAADCLKMKDARLKSGDGPQAQMAEIAIAIHAQGQRENVPTIYAAQGAVTAHRLIVS